MRVLILYIIKGSGHHHAAIALEQAFRIYYPKIEVINTSFFDCSNPLVERVVTRIYLEMLKTTPELWDFLYDNRKVLEKTKKLREFVNKLNSKKFKKFLENYSPSVIICTQAFPCGVVASIKRKENLSTPLVAVITDYIAHRYWIHDEVDMYITANQFTKHYLRIYGVDENKVKSLGIPIRCAFKNSLDTRAILHKLQLSQELPIVLVMGGGQGFGPIKEIIRSLDKCQMKMQILVVAGLNQRLKKEIDKLALSCKNIIRSFGYVENIHELMEIADILVTKPGGITCSEAIAKKLPMIIVNPIPGQEERNSQFLTQHDIAIRIDEEKAVGSAVESLLNDQPRLMRLRQTMAQFAKENASELIVKAIVDFAMHSHVQ